jgi:putative transposase
MVAEGHSCGLHRIERLMREHASRTRPRRCQLLKDSGTRSVIAPNVLERDFQADGPNRKWVADFNYIWTPQGWLYLAVVIDLYSR